MKYKKLLMMLSMAVALSSFPLPAPVYADTTTETDAEDTAKTDANGFIIEGTKLIGYEGTKEAITIPSSITEIGDGAFAGNTNLTEVEVGYTVTTIGEGAFQDCTSLEKITFPVLYTYSSGGRKVYAYSRLDSINAHAFDGCSALTAISFPEELSTIGKYAFRDCVSLTDVGAEELYTTVGGTTIYLGCDKKSLGTGAFSGCTTLTDFPWFSVGTLGDGAFRASGISYANVSQHVASIGKYVFADCANLRSVKIPASVTSIADNAFDGCDSLVVYAEHGSVAESFVLKNAMDYIDCNLGNAGMVVEPAGAYDGLPKEPEVTVISGNMILEEGVHYNVMYSDNVNAGKGTVRIEGVGDIAGTREQAFTIEQASVEFVGEREYVVELQDGEFELEQKTVPEVPVSYEIISGNNIIALDGATVNLLETGEATILASVEDTGNCKEASQEIIVKVVDSTQSDEASKEEGAKEEGMPEEDGIPEEVESTGEDGMPKYENTSTDEGLPGDAAPSKWEETSEESKKEDTKLQQNVKETKGVLVESEDCIYRIISNKKVAVTKYVGTDTKVVIPGNVKIGSNTYTVSRIAAGAFRNNKKVVSVTIPTSVDRIGAKTFYGCRKLKKLQIKSTKLQSKRIGKAAFKGTHKKICVKIPKTSVGRYKKLLVKKGISEKAKFRVYKLNSIKKITNK